ncbi:MAG: DUF1801 domain-containing protein [Myxococcaceae bacterium]|jgi:hypothetical protein|nr:MAG: DUF1801 domain-containing protein [Myxococcaceae bacterium]
MSGNKTGPTDASVEDYLASRAKAQQLEDCRELMLLLQRVSGHAPRMWGPSIVGYGSYRYAYESGRTGEAPLAGFAIRGPDLVLYLMAEGPSQQALRSRLGRHRMGKSCLYFKRLADLDRLVLEALVAASVSAARQRHDADGDAR